MRLTIMTAPLMTLAGLILSGFTSCTEVKVPNFEYCTDKSKLGAHCNKFYGANKPHNLNVPAWTQKRAVEHSYCVSSETWDRFKVSYEKACQACQCCTFDEQ